MKWDISENQWVHVIACTAMCCAMAQSWLGLIIFPLWYGVALVGANTE